MTLSCSKFYLLLFLLFSLFLIINARRIYVLSTRNSTAPTAPKSNKENFSVQDAPSSPSDHSKLYGWVLGGIVGAFLGPMLAFLSCLLFSLILLVIKGEQKKLGPIIYCPLIVKVEDLVFLEKEMVLIHYKLLEEGVVEKFIGLSQKETTK